MRGFFQRSAQRDSLRPEQNKTNKQAPGQQAPRGKSFRTLVSAFVLAALSNEAVHHHASHNPHGNRRERIEEIRNRAFEVAVHSRHQRILISGGNPPPETPETPVQRETSGRRRLASHQVQAQA